MTELAQIFAELSISQYLETFIEQGFDTWETILDITESDFDALGVKLGHRRKIQRRIADSRGISTERALASPIQHATALDDRQLSDDQKASRTKGDGKDQVALTNGGKRKYRRHPKPDENAPERPPSAYVIFSNKIREDLKHQQLSFTEIAKLVGEHWQNLPPSEKEPYESQAFAAKDIYNNALAEYKKTENYRIYQAYLAEFKAKQSSNQQAISDAEPSKRPKLEKGISNDSGSSSATSQTGGDTPISRKRVYSSSSTIGVPWYGSQNPPASQSAPPLSNTSTPKPFGGPTNVRSRTSPPITNSPRILPGYRDSLATSLPIRDTARDNESTYQKRHLPTQQQQSQPQSSISNIRISRNRTNEQHSSPFGPPPMLTHDSTVESASSGSSSVGPVFTPRTPMDMERNPQFSNLFPSKLPGFFDSNQLPPLRPPSLSPQSSVHTGYHSPQGIAPIMDYQTQAQHSLRNYQHIPTQNQQPIHLSKAVDAISQPHSTSTYDDSGELDPVSALLKAAENVDRDALRDALNRQAQHPNE